jgi:hypothetical protein
MVVFLVKGGPVKGEVGQLGTARTRVVALKKRNLSTFIQTKTTFRFFVSEIR